MTPRRPRILLTADSVGGVWTYAVDLAAGLVTRGLDVTIACLGPAPDGTRIAQVAETGARMLETDLPLDWLCAPGALADAGVRLARLVAEAGTDLLHLNSPALLAGHALPVPVVAGCHSCLATWWQAVHPGEPVPEDFRWRIERLREGYARADALIAPSRAFARATQAAHGIRPAVVWNGRPMPPAADSPRAAFALAAGRLWDPAKGLAVLDRAAQAMRHPVEAVGPTAGPAGEAVWADHVVLRGSMGQEALRTRMGQAMLFVSLARYEPFGLAVLEAAQAGCALVLADTPVFRELWDGAATFVAVDAPQEAAAAMDRLLESPQEAALLGERARLRATRYAADVMAAATLAIYARLLGREIVGIAA